MICHTAVCGVMKFCHAASPARISGSLELPFSAMHKLCTMKYDLCSVILEPRLTMRKPNVLFCNPYLSRGNLCCTLLQPYTAMRKPLLYNGATLHCHEETSAVHYSAPTLHYATLHYHQDTSAVQYCNTALP